MGKHGDADPENPAATKPAMFAMAELYGLGLRPYHAPQTFDMLERLADGVPAAAAALETRGVAGKPVRRIGAIGGP